MSSVPISRSPDLLRLEDAGYQVEVTANNYLLVHHVPYVQAPGQVAYGTLISVLTVQGDVVVKPAGHEVFWAGDWPCDSHGVRLPNLVIEEKANPEVRPGLVGRFKMSQKPTGGYPDFYEKMSSYIRIIEGHAKAIDSRVSAATRARIVVTEDASVFRYRDTASTRAGISHLSARIAEGKLAIVGLGGTGSYVLDYLAKTGAPEIHLFDRDTFDQHNAFRAPGAPSIDELRKRPTKLQHLFGIYDRMRKGIVLHEEFVTDANLGELAGMGFVFVCIDDGKAKGRIIQFLHDQSIPFVDVGMGLGIEGDSLDGLIRTTSFLGGDASQLSQISTDGGGDEDPYAENIQIAELNALNAALAVIRWKRSRNFYKASKNELQSVFWISRNMLRNYGEKDEETEDSS